MASENIRQPMFSILMANYNNALFIEDAIRSVISQTFNDWELIIVDDGSTDRSAEMIERFLSDPRVKLVKNAVRTGCGAAKRAAADRASGRIMAELDADDMLAKNALRVMGEAHDAEKDAGLIFSNHYICDEGMDAISAASWPEMPALSNLHSQSSVSHFRTYKKSVYDRTAGYDLTLPAAVDRDLVYKLEESAPIKFVNEPLYFYRRHERSVTSAHNDANAKFCNFRAALLAYERRRASGYVNLDQHELARLMADGLLQAIKLRNRGNIGFIVSAINRFRPAKGELLATIFTRIAKYASNAMIAVGRQTAEFVLGKDFIRKIRDWRVKRIFRGTEYECIFCANVIRSFLPAGSDSPASSKLLIIGAGFRENAVCPICLSLDRERLIYAYLKNKTNFLSRNIKVLHVAPEENLKKIFFNQTGIDYISADISRADVDINFDITRMPFADDTFDLLVANHILEHVLDDSSAIGEICRVVKPDGLAIMQVPISEILEKSFENPEIIGKKERFEAFGQSDHVRVYGRDYVERLEAAGFSVLVFDSLEHFGKDYIHRHGLAEREKIFLCSPRENAKQ